MLFSRLIPVRQHFPDHRIPDIRDAVQRELRASGFSSRLQPAARVALGVGSRGIANIAAIIAAIVRAVVDYWKSEGMRAFIFPAKGSHGADTA